MAAPLRDALKRPVCCTLQGEELFLNGLAAPYREQAIALIRQQVRTVDRFIAVSEYCAAFMSELLEIPAARIDVVPLGISMKGYERREDERRRVPRRVFRARGSGERAARAGRRLHALPPPHRRGARPARGGRVHGAGAQQPI